MKARLHIGDCRDVLASMPDASVHAVVCDPPYELAFMGKSWDRSGIALEVPLWREVLRVLRPGGHLVAFGGTRTHHRMYCAIEDAGFEIRDSLVYLYGSGFPKSLDVSKAIDKAAGAVREVVGDKLDRPGYHLKGHNGGQAFSAGLSTSTPESRLASATITAPASEDAERWNGWGTALKPAFEPICLARRPLSESSVAKNVLRWGTGALNIDGCRIETTDSLGGGAEKAETVCATNHEGWDRPWKHSDEGRAAHADQVRSNVAKAESLGRWPANLLLDEEAAAMLDDQAGERTSGKPCGVRGEDRNRNSYGKQAGGSPITGFGDTGGALRFFFTAKPSVEERESGLLHLAPATRHRVNGGGLENDPKWAPTSRRNNHPTVKPFSLMSWLVRLVTPPSGIVLDPFVGSGTTGMAAVAEGFDFIGCDLDERHVAISEGRIRNVAPLLVNVTVVI